MKLNNILILRNIIFFFTIFNLNTAIGQTELSICEGECVEIGEISEFCYSWDNSFENPQQNFQTVCPSERTFYSVTITDDNGNIKDVAQYLVNVFSVDATISPNPGTLCSINEPILLEVNSNFNGYIWENEEGENIGNSYFISVSTPGEYSVTVTGNNGCTATDIATVINPEDPEDIKDYLISEGFICYPATVNGTVGLLPSTVPNDNLENTSTLSFRIENDNEAHLRLEELLNSDIESVIEGEFNPMMRITDYGAICSPGTTLNEFLNVNEFDVSILIYIYDDPDSDEDCLLTKINYLDLTKLTFDGELRGGDPYFPKCEGDVSSDFINNECCATLPSNPSDCVWDAITYDASDGHHYYMDCPLDTWTTTFVSSEYFIDNLEPTTNIPGTGVWEWGRPEALTWANAPTFNAWLTIFSPTEALEAAMLDALTTAATGDVDTYVREVFTWFKNAGGQDFIQPCDSPISTYLFRVKGTRTQMNTIMITILSHFRDWKTLQNYDITQHEIRPFNYRFLGRVNTESTLNAHSFLGGTQGVGIDIISMKQEEGVCSGDENGIIDFTFEANLRIGDTFTIRYEDAADQWWIPGVIAQWSLQHFRNNECVPPCYRPFEHHISVSIPPALAGFIECN